MTSQHPITPPPEMVDKWETDWHHSGPEYTDYATFMATKAARWGADQELEACCELLDGCMVVQIDNSANTAQNRLAGKDRVARLRTIRRPKPPSLKEQALEVFDKFEHLFDGYGDDGKTIRRALEQLDD